MHWVSPATRSPPRSASTARSSRTRSPDPHAPGGLGASLDPGSLEVVERAWLEPALATAAVGERFQFERLGYFCTDPDSRPGQLVFNRTATLRDTWAKVAKQSGPGGD
jgi:glutaminyl-tRNA synthetase